MGRVIEVNTSTLKQDANDIGQDLKDMRSMLDTLIESAGTLETMWEGPSSEAFNRTFNNHLSILEDVYAALTEIHEYEEYSIKEYNDCEKKVEGLIGQISNR